MELLCWVAACLVRKGGNKEEGLWTSPGGTSKRSLIKDHWCQKEAAVSGVDSISGPTGEGMHGHDQCKCIRLCKTT